MQLSCNCCTKAEYFQVCYFLKNDKMLVARQGTGWALLSQNCSEQGRVCPKTDPAFAEG